MRFRLIVSAAPAAMGMPPPTMPLVPRKFFSMSVMCMEPPMPWQTPVARPNISAISAAAETPEASACPWPRCVLMR